ncbi:MAG: serine hydrolase [Clostridia bacterium]|nr:serine hydrolase [Clostridia bacterium]
MIKQFPKTEEFIKKHIALGGAGDVMISVGTLDESYRFMHSNRGDVLKDTTLCDMMSVTKILAATPMVLIAIAEGKLSLSTTVFDIFNEAPEHLAPITVEQLLTHTSGLRHSFLPMSGAPYTHEEALVEQWKKKLFAVPGESSVYACNNMILLALAVERIYQKELDELFNTRVAEPLGFEHTHFRCDEDADRIICTRQKNDYICDDPSARRIGGVSGNAGIFSCLRDMEKYARALLCGFDKILPREVFDAAKRNYTAHLTESRGLGFVYVDERYPQTGRLFSNGSIGHCGHSGQSVFVDFEKWMYVVILSNTTFYSACRGGTYSETMKFREDLHNKIADDLGI